MGNVTNRFIDGVGRLAALTNPLGNSTRYEYDPLSRLTKVTDSLNSLAQFSYDPNGNLLSVTDPRSGVTGYAYNNMDRLETRTDPLLRAENYQYDLAGNLTQFTDRKSQVTTYTYDGLNRRTGVTYQDTSTTTYTYDKGNRLVEINDSIAGIITRTYDGLDRLTSETTPQGSVSYTYDAVSRRETMTVSGQPTVNYAYNNANHLMQITQGSSVVQFGYDNANRRTSLTLPNNVLVEYAYDDVSRITSITYKQNGTAVLGDLTYEYDKAGNRTKIGGSFARTGIPQDINTTNYNLANQQTTFGDKTLTYDNNGNLQTITDSSGTITYTWNARNQLVGISGPGVNATFVYDGLGRREEKTVNGNLTEFLYDGVNPAHESSGSTTLANILPALGIDEFLTRTDVVAGVTSNFLADALGSIFALTDATGIIQTEYIYEPFGETVVTGSSSSSPFQFTARENDNTGLYYYRARYYHPGLKRFIAEDPPSHRYGHGAEMWSPVPYLKFTHESIMMGNSVSPQIDPLLATMITSQGPVAVLVPQAAAIQISCGKIPGAPNYENLYGYVSFSPINKADPSGLGRPGECQQYTRDCSKGQNIYSCVAILPCVISGDRETSNCIRNCLLDDYRGGCTGLQCQIESHRKCFSRCL